MKEFKVEHNSLSASEYLFLRNTTDWPKVSLLDVEIALRSDLFSVSVLHENLIIGMGRIIGDGSLYFYIQDIVVHNDYRGMRIGSTIMQHLEDYLDRNARPLSFIGLMAAKGTERFYEKWEYQRRNASSPGMYRYGPKKNGGASVLSGW